MKDIGIIGGSASGFFTACLLAQKGLNVKVYEASESVDSPPRTLIVTSYLSSLIGSLCEDSVINKIQSYDLYADGRFGKVSLRHPDVVIERSGLIRRLAERAEASGVKIYTGHRFIGLKPNGKQLTFTVSPGEISGMLGLGFASTTDSIFIV